MKRPDLVVNIGNTNTTLALVRGGCIVRRLRRPTADGVPNLGSLRRGFFRASEVGGAIVASVVPGSTAAWLAICRAAGAAPVLELGHRMNLGLRLRYRATATLGADRLADLAAIPGRFVGPVLVVDAGTAVTFNAIDARGDFVGGVIAPGPALMLDYLADRTAKLPRLAAAPCHARIGTDTATSMRIGAREGYRGLLAGILGHLLKQPGLRDATVVATGGGADWLRGLAPRVAIDPDLTLKGLARALELNR